jgi:glycosyltransferase involved in cell wall biosynthesis
MDVSIFIRSRNEAAYIGRCLQQIACQNTSLCREVIVLDSESSDRTVEIAREYGARVYRIPRTLFGYSRALNFGVRKASGRYFVALSAHAVPLDESWLEELVRPLEEDPTVAAAFSRQLPWPDACRTEREAARLQFPESGWVRTPGEFRSAIERRLDPFEQLKFSNVSSAMRREVAERHPFRELPFSEDRAFAFECLLEGSGVAYAPRSVVNHSHEPSLREFRSVAVRAALSRAAINQMVRHAYGLPAPPPARFGRELLWGKLLGLAALVGCKGVCRLLFSRDPERRREFQFYFASLGTTLGKLAGLRRLEAEGELRAPPVAQPAEIEGAAAETS